MKQRVPDPRRTTLTVKVTRPEAVALKLLSRKHRITRSSLIRQYIVQGLQTEAA